jgi:hypothetical protein
MKDVQATREASTSALNRENPALQEMYSLFFFFWVFLPSRIRIRIRLQLTRIRADPCVSDLNPQPCTEVISVVWWFLRTYILTCTVLALDRI